MVNPQADQPRSYRKERGCIGICLQGRRPSRVSSCSAMTDDEADCLDGSATASGVVRLAIAWICVASRST